nr:DUF2939 domain-containing protein [uncultured Rhodopila sp.]
MPIRAKWSVVAAVLVAGLTYGAYPYVTLYRLGAAIQTSDATTLESLVDWPAVREGIKEDVCDLVLDDPGPKTQTSLPPFGASFMRGIAANAIDQAVTPQALLAATGTISQPARQPPMDRYAQARPAPEQKTADVRVKWAFFDSPTTFLVSLQARGQADPIKLEMALHHGAWQVQRVWLPADLLTNSGSPT